MVRSNSGVPERLTTAFVSTTSGYSVQQVRDLEALGVISATSRAANGYREFSNLHVRDLRAYRDFAAAVGPVRARHTMREIRTLPRDQAAALLSSFHTALDRERNDALAAQRALHVIRAEALVEAEPVERDSMTITELADALGVRASTLRFWEKSGLVVPQRVATQASTARRYPPAAVSQARITATLRAAGYRIPDVQHAMTAIRQFGDQGDPLTALESHVEHIAQRTLALLRAGAVLAEIITTRFT